MKTFKSRISALLLAAGSVSATAGCAQDMEQIDRVQNNLTKKGDLRGEWYYRQTVVKAPYTSVAFFPGNQSMLQRGVFEITEGTLFFYRTYELMIGGETLGAASDIDTPLYETDASGNIVMKDGKPVPVTYQRRIGDQLVTVQKYVYRGVPLAAFGIDSHFDVQRGYNPMTGEETNVVQEDNGTRQWWEREYMRVSWGAMKGITPVDFPSVSGVASGASEFLDSEFDSEEAPVFERSADGTLDYFDYQVRVTYGANTTYLEEYGTIPTCLFYPWSLGQVTECVSENVTFREGFQKVKPSDYVAWDYDDKKLKKFGFFRSERPNYDAIYGNTYSGASRRIERHRIWEKYVVKKGEKCTSPTGDKKGSCADGNVCESLDDGMYCVAADANDRLDYASMTAKPVVYYLSQQYPRDLVPEAWTIANHWNKPLADVVVARKGGTAPTMFFLCENNLAEATSAMKAMGKDINNAADVKAAQDAGQLASIDGSVCATMDKPKRIGDLRYSMIFSVNEPISYGLYGYGPSSVDPLSGETLSANAYMYTPAMKQGANSAMVAIELATGIRNFWDTTYANDVIERSSKMRLGASQGGLPHHTMASATAMADELLSPEVMERLQTQGVEKTDQNFAEARLAILSDRNPALAAQLVTEDVKMAHKDPSILDPSHDTTEALVKRMGPQVWGHKEGSVGKYVREKFSHGEKACRFEAEFADGAILGLAREFGDKVNAAVCEKAKSSPVFDFQAFEKTKGACTTKGVKSEDGLLNCEELTLDDKGTKGTFWVDRCTIGKLKAQLANAIVVAEQTNPYNFQQDYYPPDPIYTDTKNQALNDAQVLLRDEIDAQRNAIIHDLYKRIWLGTAEHEVGHTLGLRHNFEASTDAMNFGKEYWTIKGKYDTNGKFQAFDMFGGETFAQQLDKMRQMQSASVMDYSAKFNDRFGGVGLYDEAAIRYGYGGLLDVFTTAPEMTDFSKYLADPRDEDPSNYAALPEYASTTLEKLFKRVHYTKIPDLFPGDTDHAKLYDRKHVPASEVGTQVEVPFRFCSDELNTALPTCASWDSGVDSFEMARNAMADYEEYWPLWGFSHDSIFFQPSNYYNRVANQFGTVKMQMQWWVLEYQRFNRNGWWEKRFGKSWDKDENGGLTGSVAVGDSINVLSGIFGRPEPGMHGYNGDKKTFEPLPFLDSTLYSNFKLITPTNCAARDFYPSYDYAGYLPIVERAGSIYDRLVAYEVMADPTGWFVANDTRPDSERYLVSYFTLFPKEIMNLYSAMIANKTDTWGWYMVTDDKGNPDHCVRRNLIGKNAMNIDELKATLPAGQKAWALNPEPEYTFPTTRFRVPMLAAVYGLSMFNDSFNNNYVDVTRVFVDGHKDGITPSDDATVNSFTDPLSGKTYTAVVSKFNDGLLHPASVMIDELKTELAKYPKLEDLQNNYNYSQYQFTLDKLELLRGMNSAYDSLSN